MNSTDAFFIFENNLKNNFNIMQASFHLPDLTAGEALDSLEDGVVDGERDDELVLAADQAVQEEEPAEDEGGAPEEDGGGGEGKED